MRQLVVFNPKKTSLKGDFTVNFYFTSGSQYNPRKHLCSWEITDATDDGLCEVSTPTSTNQQSCSNNNTTLGKVTKNKQCEKDQGAITH